MESEFQQYELIEQYLSGALTGEALNDFNARLNNDPAFKKEVALHRDIEIGLMEKEDIPFIKTLNDIHQKETAETISDTESTQSNIIFRYLKIVVSVAAVLIGGIFISQFLTQSPTPLALSEKMIGEPLEQRSVRNSTNKNEELDRAFQQIDNKNYKEAISTLLMLYENNINVKESGLALGYCYMLDAQYKQAAVLFNQLLAYNNLNNTDQINWYLAHVYLRNEQFDQSTEVLESMLNGTTLTSKKKEDLEKLIEEINKQFL